MCSEKSVRDHLDRIAEIDDEYRRLLIARANEIDLLSEHHPLSVGDVVEVNGYSHRGKTMTVKGTFVKSTIWGLEWVAHGIVDKKGRNRATWSQVIKTHGGVDQWAE